MTVRTYGSDGPWVVCVHGGPGAPGELAPVAERLGRRFRVLEPFERRSGRQPLSLRVHVDDLAHLVESIGAPKVGVVGFSSGAITALTFAASHPDLTSTAVVIGAATLTTDARAEFKRRLAERLDPASSARLAELKSRPETDDRLKAQAALVTEAYLTDAVSRTGSSWVDAQGHRETWSDMLRYQQIGEHPAAFRSIKSATLMIHGSDDPHPGEMIFDSLRSAIPHLQYVELPRCGHYPWLERAASEEFYAALEEWLTSHAVPQL